MKLRNSNFKNWSLNVQCHGNKYWLDKHLSCCRFSELSYKDIVCRKFIVNLFFIKYTRIVYGFICNSCRCFTIIDHSFIPAYIKNSCLQVADLNSPFYGELSYEERLLSKNLIF